RAQCELARLAPDDDRADDLRLVAQDLLTAHTDNAAIVGLTNWLESIGSFLGEPRFRRGFLEAAEVQAGNMVVFLRNAAAVAARVPLRELRVVAQYGLGVPLAEFLACPLLGRLDRLAFHGYLHVVGDDDWPSRGDP